MEEVRQLYLIADGDHLYRAPKDLMGRAPIRGERVDYKRLLHKASWEVFGPRRVSAHYFQRQHQGGDALYTTLQNMGYQLHLYPYAEGWEQVKDAIAEMLGKVHEVDCDLLYVGGDNYRGQFEILLERLLSSPVEREIGIVHLAGACQFNTARFTTFDLISDLGVMPASIYTAAEEASQYPAGYPSSYSSYSTDDQAANTVIGDQLQAQTGYRPAPEPPVAAPEPLPPPRRPQLFHHNYEIPPQRPQPPVVEEVAPAPAPPAPIAAPPQAAPATPSPAPPAAPAAPIAAAPPAAPPVAPAAPPAAPRQEVAAGPRNILVLIDHENIDWSLGNLIGPAQLNMDTRPRWSTLREFAQQRAQGGAVQFLSFLQHSDVVTGFAVYLDGEEGFKPILLTSEVDATGRRRPVVDEAIQRSLTGIRNRSCDVLVVSNDGGYLPHLEDLRTHGTDDDRRFGVIGFIDEMSALYRQLEWIDVFDLERDVGAFTYQLPRRYMPIAVDQFDVTSILGDFGLPADGTGEQVVQAVEQEAANFEVELTGVGSNTTAVILALHTAAGIPKLQGKRLIESIPATVADNLTEAAAEHVQAVLEAAGAAVTLYEVEEVS